MDQEPIPAFLEGASDLLHPGGPNEFFRPESVSFKNYELCRSKRNASEAQGNTRQLTDFPPFPKIEFATQYGQGYGLRPSTHNISASICHTRDFRSVVKELESVCFTSRLS